MTEKQPTQEQIKEFWGWCGCQGNVLKYLANSSLSLDNLFKYAVPKMRYANIQFSDQYSDVVPQFSATASIQFADNHTWADNDPALALFWALWQVKEASK